MNVTSLSWKHCRNLNGGQILPDDEVNVIYGDNAQGKTNLLELLWIYTGGRSFRGAKDAELVQIGHTRAESELTFFAEGREQTARIELADGRRKCFRNEIPQKSAANMVGGFCAVVFAPVHLSLVRDGPAERRRFLDAAICQTKPSYAALLSRYNRVIEQRNALLKELFKRPSLAVTLPEWNEKTAQLAALVTEARLRYLKKLQPAAEETYFGISSEREKLTIRYRRSGVAEQIADETAVDEPLPTAAELLPCLKKTLEEASAADRAAGFTTVGPHRDDFSLCINGLSARSFGSQGQQRSAVLALKLGEAAVLGESIGESPVILLDDVLSELDALRQDYLLNRMAGRQVFITCCEPTPVLRLRGGRAFHMQNGILT